MSKRRMGGLRRVTTHRILEGKRGIRKAYDMMSRNYDSSKHLHITRKMEIGEEKAVEKLLRLFPPPVLDVGCGTGRYAVKMAEKGVEVVALDVSRGMLHKTVEKARGLKASEKVHPVVADGGNLPFRKRSVKGLVCTLTIDHFENREEMVKGFSEVLAGGSLCVVTTINKKILDSFRRLHRLPPGKISFMTDSSECFLIYEDSPPLEVFIRIAEKYFEVVTLKGCFYCYLLPFTLASLYYKTRLENLLSSFKPLLKYAGIHVILLKSFQSMEDSSPAV
ncbi:MAG: class I SAM-dependent methyltransferase [Thermoproteota archaeon]